MNRATRDTSSPRVFTIRLPSLLAAELHTAAEVEGLHDAEAIRRAVEEYLDNRKRDAGFQALLRAQIEHTRQMLLEPSEELA